MKKEVLPQKDDQKSQKKNWTRSKTKKRIENKKWQRYSPLPSPSSSSNDNSDESKHRNNEGKEGTASRFRVFPEEDQYKYILPPEIAQYPNVNFDTKIKEAGLIKAVLIRNPGSEDINPVKTLANFVKDILKDKKNKKDLGFGNLFNKNSRSKSIRYGFFIKIWTSVESARLSQEDSVETGLKEIQEFMEQTVLLLGQVSNSISTTEDFT